MTQEVMTVEAEVVDAEVVETTAIEQATFDYGALGFRTRARVQKITAKIHERLHRIAEEIIETGKDLIEAKEVLPHGAWLPWLEAEFDWGETTARNFMRVASCFSNPQTFEDLPSIAPSTLYLLAAPSTPDDLREEVIRRFSEGQRLTYREVLQLKGVKRHRPGDRGSETTDEHYTPADVVTAVLEAFGGQCDLDPCSNSKETPSVPAKRLFTKEDNGLIQHWDGSTFVNPPFSDIAQWVKKGLAEVEESWCELIFLCKSDNRTDWYQKLMDCATCYCEYRGYMKFGGASNCATFAVTIFYFGENIDRFYYAFSKIGWVCQVLEPGLFGE